MGEAQTDQKVPANRCFGGNCPPKPDPGKEQKIKDVLLTASQRRRAKAEIRHLLKTFHGKIKLRELLGAMEQRGYPDYVIKVAIEKVEAEMELERKRNELPRKEEEDFEKFKSSLGKISK
jgi:hypothetical protein